MLDGRHELHGRIAQCGKRAHVTVHVVHFHLAPGGQHVGDHPGFLVQPRVGALDFHRRSDVAPLEAHAGHLGLDHHAFAVRIHRDGRPRRRVVESHRPAGDRVRPVLDQFAAGEVGEVEAGSGDDFIALAAEIAAAVHRADVHVEERGHDVVDDAVAPALHPPEDQPVIPGVADAPVHPVQLRRILDCQGSAATGVGGDGGPGEAGKEETAVDHLLHSCRRGGDPAYINPSARLRFSAETSITSICPLPHRSKTWPRPRIARKRP